MEMLRERKIDRVLVLKLRFILKVFRKISIGGKHEKIKEGIQGLKEIKNQTYTRSVGSTVACLGALLGINGAVAYIIAGTCTTACSAAPVTGAVCAACIGGICAIGAGDIVGIVTCFKS